jgi:NitT/TauT family transport system substrate-binding protein
MCTHADRVKNDPALITAFLQMHRKATEYALGNRAAFIAMCEQKLGLPAKTVELAAPNIELTWRIDDDWVTRAKYYGAQMLDKKQIRQLPDYTTFINTSFAKSI